MKFNFILLGGILWFFLQALSKNTNSTNSIIIVTMSRSSNCEYVVIWFLIVLSNKYLRDGFCGIYIAPCKGDM